MVNIKEAYKMCVTSILVSCIQNTRYTVQFCKCIHICLASRMCLFCL